MKVRLKEGCAPIVFGSFLAPAHPEYFEVPSNYTTGARRHIDDGKLEYAPREAAAVAPLAPAKIDRKGFASRRPSK